MTASSTASASYIGSTTLELRFYEHALNQALHDKVAAMLQTKADSNRSNRRKFGF